MIEQYAVFIGATETGQLAGCRRLLSPEKALRVDRFRFDRDKVRGIIGETMVRYLAETRFGIPGRQLAPDDFLTVCAACGLRQELARPVIRLAAEELEKYAQGI